MRNAFKAYDIRGIFNVDFNIYDVYRIGYFLPRLLNASEILIGMDVRVSSEIIYKSLCEGITDSGADVHYCGLSTTPMIYWVTAKYNYAASVMITASHNPPKYNGLKISRKDALPVGYDSGLEELLKMAENAEIDLNAQKGNVKYLDFKPAYLKFLKHFIPDLSGLKIAIDCSNGMSSMLIKELFGDSPIYLYDELDGTFPNHDPNPLEEKNITDLSRIVVKNSCDVGIIFDGDADRVMFVDEKGKFIQPDLMIAILADYFADKGFKGRCLQDIRTSKSVTEYVESKGFEMDIWRVGRAYASLKLREIDGIFGGELAGHYYFRDFYYSDSGYLASLLLLGEIQKAKLKNIPLSLLISHISSYYGSGEINLQIDNKQHAIEVLVREIKKCESATKVMDFDGYRLEFNDWWFNIRPSNTEPYLRLIIEAKTPTLLEQKSNAIMKILQPFINPYSHGH